MSYHDTGTRLRVNLKTTSANRTPGSLHNIDNSNVLFQVTESNCLQIRVDMYSDVQQSVVA